ncbi:MAG: hypothetical protein ACSHYB_18235 [Roseibacillus sp.]
MSTSTSGIEIELDHFHHQPFQELKGKVRITTPTPPEGMELRVFWFTRGRGDEEASIIHRLKLETAQALTNFSWKLPAAPYSFAGKLITLAWAIEVVDENEQSLDLVPFLLSPSGEEVQLEAIPDNSRAGKLKEKLEKKFGPPRSQ